ncbi:alpha-amylase family glycosyl hydrolase [Cytophaga aurantiaca]|uniref:alpha-amylase family glycosyl hydrolase n=1 Tax=Cytophaga aurantiaca TaxID=29530 RepID=UPI000381DEB9|nr:alpha-amylase family glycosyl hydrolase [Cytophaga aurantiaca]
MKSIEEISLSEITKGKHYWNSEKPIEEEIMYFLLVDRFHDGKDRNTISSREGFGNAEQLKARCGGTIKGITKQLDYIFEMGFTSVWINPFLQNNTESYHGYAIENFLEVDPQWGSKEDVIELVAKAHALHMRVFFDIVLNHTGDNWSYKVSNPVYKNGIQYATKAWRFEDKPIPIELRNFNCYSRKGRIRQWEEKPETWDGDIFELKDLIQNDSIVGQQNLDIMVAVYSYWFALTDCDGFRIDAAKHINPSWLNQFITAIKKNAAEVQKDFFVFAEIIGGESIVKEYPTIDGYLDFNFYFSSVDKLLRKKNSKIRFGEGHLKALPVRFLDNHDQIGQMPKQRIGYALNEPVLVNLLRAFLLIPGLPCVYYGTEQGLTGRGRNDGEIRECLFDPLGTGDLFDRNSIYFKTIQQFSALRVKWKMFHGKVESCKILNSVFNKCIALQISSLSASKLIFYNLGAENEQVSIKLAHPISRTNKLVVYLYSDNGRIELEAQIRNNIVCDISIAPFGFIVLDLGVAI